MGTTRLAYPMGVTKDVSGDFYVCDTRNQRVIKLNADLEFVAEYITSLSIGTPYSVMYDSVTGDIYVAGVWGAMWVRIQRFTTSLDSVRVSDNLHDTQELLYRPTGICRHFDADKIIVSGANSDLFVTTETTSFSSFVAQAIHGESIDNIYNSIIHHSDGNIYVNNGKKIMRVNSSFVNIGDSDIIGHAIFGLKEGNSSSILTYDIDTLTVKRYDNNLNFVEDVYWNTGSTIETDAYDVVDFVEV